MSISSRFSVAIHILVLLETNPKEKCSSEYLARSINTNPVVVRKITGMLKKAGLVSVRPGVAGMSLLKDLSELSLFDVYQAVEVVKEDALFSIHERPNPDCLVGRNIQATIDPVFIQAQEAMEAVLRDYSLSDMLQRIQTNEKMNK